MSGKRARVRRRTAEEAARLVAEYETGVLSRSDFCRKHGLAASTLDAYRSGRRLALAAKPKPAQFVAVEVQATPGGPRAAEGALTVVLGQGRPIEVRRGFDAGTLTELLNVLERA